MDINHDEKLDYRWSNTKWFYSIDNTFYITTYKYKWPKNGNKISTYTYTYDNQKCNIVKHKFLDFGYLYLKNNNLFFKKYSQTCNITELTTRKAFL